MGPLLFCDKFFQPMSGLPISTHPVTIAGSSMFAKIWGIVLERCNCRCIRTITMCPLADPADSFVLVLPAWEICANKPWHRGSCRGGPTRPPGGFLTTAQLVPQLLPRVSPRDFRH